MNKKKELTKEQEAGVERATDPLNLKVPAEKVQQELVKYMNKLGIQAAPEYATKNPPEFTSSRKARVVMGQGGPDFGRPAPTGGGITDFEVSDKQLDPDEELKVPKYKQRFGISDIPRGNIPQQKTQDQLDFEEMAQNAKIFEARKEEAEPVHFGDPRELMKNGKFDAQGIRALINGGQLKEENVPNLVKDGFLDQNEAAKLQFKQKALQRFLKQGK